MSQYEDGHRIGERRFSIVQQMFLVVNGKKRGCLNDVTFKQPLRLS